MTVKILLLPGLPEKGDIVEWIENHGDACEPESMKAEIEAMAAAVEPVKPAGTAKESLEMFTEDELIEQNPEMDKPVIEGVVRFFEILNIIATSKAKKSWLMLMIVLSVLHGRKLFNRFWTTPCNILLIDNELRKPTIASRLRKVREAMGLSAKDATHKLTVVSLRGNLMDLRKLSTLLMDLEPGKYGMIVLDAFYRFLPEGVDENSNADLTQLYNLLDRIAAYLRCAIIVVHHASKGNQATRAVVDIGSGAGAMARAADSHLAIVAHEADEAAVFAFVTRSFPPSESFVARWVKPLWIEDDSLDPTQLKQERPRRKASTNEGSKEEARQAKEQANRIKVLEVFEDRPDGETESKLSAAAGMSTRVYSPIHESLLKAKLIAKCKVKKRHAEYDGFKITDAGLDELRQLRQLRQDSDLSDLSDMNSDKRPSLEGAVCRTSDRTIEVSLWKGI